MNRKNYGMIYSTPITLWITVFFVLPTCIVFVYSFLKKRLYGGVIWEFSLEAYKALINPSFLKVVWFTVYVSVISTFIIILFAIPVSYFIARSKNKNFYLFLIIVPFWTNFLIRIFSWIAILGNNGFVNNLFLSLGIIQDPIKMLYNQYAIIIVTVYTYLPYAILPLYSTIEKFDFNLLEAARDLGASKSGSMIKVFLPNIRGGVVTATLFTLIPSLGAYAIPQLVGGLETMMIGNIIARELKVTQNWPLASAMSLVLTVVTTLAILIFVNKNSKEKMKMYNGSPRELFRWKGSMGK